MRAASSLRGLEMIPAVSTLGIQKKFPVALGSEDRAFDDISLEPQGFNRRADTVAGGAIGIASGHFALNHTYGNQQSRFALVPVQGGAMLTYRVSLP